MATPNKPLLDQEAVTTEDEHLMGSGKPRNYSMTDGSPLSFQHKRPKKVSKYVLGPIMGKGVYGLVRDALFMEGQKATRCAVKCISKSFRTKSDAKQIEQILLNEVEYLQRFFNENVIRATDIFCSPDGKDYMVLPIAICSLQQLVDVREMEMARRRSGMSGTSFGSLPPSSSSVASPHGPHSEETTPTLTANYPDSAHLFRFSSRKLLPTALVTDIVFQILTGVEYLHHQKIFHNDIKPDNILLFADGTVKLTDLGHCGSRYKGHGTPHFLSPQAAGLAEEEPIDAAKNDVWAVGIIMFYLLTNKFPFHGEDQFQLYRSIREDDIMWEWIHKDDEHLLPLLQALLERDESKRISAKDALEHSCLMQENLSSSFAHKLDGEAPSQATNEPINTTAQQQHPEVAKKYEQKQASILSLGSSSNSRKAVSCHYNVQRLFNRKQITEMIQLDQERHDAFLHELRYILALPVTSKSSLEKYNQLRPGFIPTIEFTHYARKGKSDNDVRCLRNDPMKLSALTNYFNSVLEKGGEASAENGGKPPAAGNPTSQNCPKSTCTMV